MTSSLRPEVLSRIESYSPKKPDVRGNWPLIAPTVRAAVVAAAPQQVGDAWELISRAAGFVNWAVRIAGAPNSPGEVFAARYIDRYAESRLKAGINPRTVASHTSKLRLIMRAVHGRGAPRVRKKATQLEPPYTATELSAHLAWARTRGTRARRDTAVVALALGAGAGLRPREIASIEERDLLMTRDTLSVDVSTGEHARIVPVAETWAGVLRAHATGEPTRRLVSVGVTTDRLLKLTDFDDVAPPFSLHRLRITWCVAAAAALPAAEFLRAAGLSTMHSLTPYLQFIALRPEADVAPELRGLTY